MNIGDGRWLALLAGLGWALGLGSLLGAYGSASRAMERLNRLMAGPSAPVTPAGWSGRLAERLPDSLRDRWRPSGAEERAALSMTGVDPIEVHALGVLAAIALAGASLALGLAGVGPSPAAGLAVGFGLAVGGPRLWLNRALTRHRMAVERELPQVAELMTLGAESGLELVDAVRLAAGLCSGPVGRALRETLAEVSAGREMAGALRETVRRLGGPAAAGFIGALVQGIELGTPVARVLRIQADTFRVRRRQAVEARIAGLPLKLTMATIFFFVPALLVLSVLPNLLAFLGSQW